MEESFVNNLISLVKQNLIILVLATLGVIFLVIGVMQMLSGQNKSSDIEFKAGEEHDVSPSYEVKSASTQSIVVDISGAVNHPGVYKLSSDARIQDAIMAAGGLASDANQDAISKTINLSQKAVDSMKIYIPKQGEQGSVANTGYVGDKGNKQININSASSSELENLPAVGPVTANKIISGRPYTKIEDLIEKKIVGASTFEKIKELISVY